jgi:hypothetical protein
LILGTFLFITAHIPIFVKKALDEMDFWIGTFGLVVFALLEALVFFWFYNSKEAWKELTRDNDIKIPYLFYYIMKYVAPTLLIIILLSWSIQQLPAKLTENDINVWIARLFIIALVIVSVLLVKYTWSKRGNKNDRAFT